MFYVRFYIVFIYTLVLCLGSETTVWGQKKIDSRSLEAAAKAKDWPKYQAEAFSLTENLLAEERYQDLIQNAPNWINQLENVGTAPTENWAQLNKNVGIAFYILDDYSNCLIYLQKTLFIRKKINPTNPDLARDYANIGQLQRFLGRYTEALTALDQATKLQKDEELLAHIYNEFSVVYNKLGNFVKALEYADLGLLLNENLYGNSSVELAVSYIGKGEILFKTIEYEKSLVALQRANRIYNNLAQPDYDNQIVCLLQIGTVFLNLTSDAPNTKRFLDSALVYQRRAEAFTPYLSANSPIIYNNAIALAAVFGAQQNLTTQKTYLDKAASIARKIFPLKHTAVANLYQAYGEYYRAQNNPSQALIYHQKQIVALIEGYDASDVNSLPAEKSFADCLSIESLTEALASKARASYALFLQTNDRKDLERALFTIILFDKLINFVRQNSADANNVKWAEFSFDGYENAIQICVAFHEVTKEKKFLNQAFYFSEKSKGFSLLQAFQTTKASKLAGISPELLAEESQLKLDISELDQELYIISAKKNKDNLEQIITLQTKISNKRAQYEVFMRKLETEYPQYHQIKYDVRLLSIDETRKLITDDQAVVSYFVGDKNTYIFKITKTDFEVKVLNITAAELLKEIETLRNSIYGYFLNGMERSPENYKAQAEIFCRSARKLYSLLVEPLLPLPSRLLVVPDGAISFLPFDVLLTAEPTDPQMFKHHAYLVKQFSISYSYSATLLQEMQQKKHAEKLKTFLAFAPKFEADASVSIRGKSYNLSPLASNEPEVRQIRDLLHTGTIFVGDEATEDKFKELASDYRIIHFATHGLANNDFPDYSLLAFSPIKDTIENELLYVSDLYNMKLNADLVVLSACETGIGKMARGEGIISLARGFSYAGAKSIFTTLWSVNDQATATIVLLFYQNLQKGQAKDIALQNAKIEFLENANNEAAHPFFWSPYIIIGDVVPLQGLQKTSTWLLWLIYGGGFVVAAAALAWIRRRLANRKA
jgi:CHAT domain-containing protein/tetratricopeptide (TPR) repeat protein